MKTPEQAAAIPVKIITRDFEADWIFVNYKGKSIKCPEITMNSEYQEKVIDLSHKKIELAQQAKEWDVRR